mmetsp:Transcript_40160/g.84367  ORF Transcript_40160/g.84367 Transcript_40160/m.84367 type:complete len:639 (-) Transcript_40160:138-2054(-)
MSPNQNQNDGSDDDGLDEEQGLPPTLSETSASSVEDDESEHSSGRASPPAADVPTEISSPVNPSNEKDEEGEGPGLNDDVNAELDRSRQADSTFVNNDKPKGAMNLPVTSFDDEAGEDTDGDLNEMDRDRLSDASGKINSGLHADDGDPEDAKSMVKPLLDGQDQSTPETPDTLVESERDEEDEEPTRRTPCYKEKRKRFAMDFVLGAITAVTLAVLFSFKVNEEKMAVPAVAVANVGLPTAAPNSTQPSSAPSTSIKPTALSSFAPPSSQSFLSTDSKSITAEPSASLSSWPSLYPSLSSHPSTIPSLSSTPTSSSSPSTSYLPSMTPSATLSPTDTWHCINIAMHYDEFPSTNEWKLFRVVKELNHDYEELELTNHTGSVGNSSHIDSICLQEGKYRFKIQKYYCDDCTFLGYYNITTSDGMPIIKGGEFKESESAYFDIPFTPHPSNSPSLSAYPSITATPSNSPSSSSRPTESCYSVEVTVAFDDCPEQTSWELIRLASYDAEEMVIKSYKWDDVSGGEIDTTFHRESICLQEGFYDFTITDIWGDGIYPPGHYNVTSNGLVIATGGDFLISETTVFSIPYIETNSTSINGTIPLHNSTESLSIPPMELMPGEISRKRERTTDSTNSLVLSEDE